MATARSFAELTVSMANASRAPAPERRTTVNPRIAAGLTPQEWDRKRRRARRAEWEARSASHAATVNGPPVRGAFVSFEDAQIARWRAESVVDKRVPLIIATHFQHPEKGVTVGAFYSAKMRRHGSLGDLAILNPFYDAIMEDARREN